MTDSAGQAEVLIDVAGVTQDFGRLRALDGLDLRIPPGSTGLLGPNGAGKSTLIRVLLGLLAPRQGQGRIFGLDMLREVRQIRRRVGYVPERDAHVPIMTALDYVAMMGELCGLRRARATQRAHEVLFYVDLGEARYRAVDGFSAGMRQRLKLAAALVHDPDLLLLDEPTNGLDPAGRRFMLDLIREVQSAGVSIVVSTHLLPDVQEVCSRVAVVTAGKVVRQGTVEELTRGIHRSLILKIVGDPACLIAALGTRGITARYEPTRGEMALMLPEDDATRPVFEAAREAGVGIKHLVPGSRSLEEVFLESVGALDAGP